MINEIRSAGVIGAGTMGSGIAQTFAASGYQVVIRDLKPQFLDRGIAAISKSLDRLAARGKLKPEDHGATLARIRPTTELNDLSNVDIVIEAILENYELKADLIRELDTICRSETIFATNTSSI